LQGIVYQFDNLDELAILLDASSGDRELSLPCHDGVRNGEWLLVTLRIGEDATCAAGKVADRGGELRVVFEERDWDRLECFARGDGVPSIPPSAQAYIPELISAPAGATALLVDEDATVLTILRAMLAACGVDTHIASSAEEALDLLRRKSFDVVIVEPALDGMSGLELCRRLRAEPSFASMPILVLTSHTTDRDIREAVHAGADDFVAKPFRAHELRARVLGLMQRAQTCVASERTF
jgi:two-component system phosphate regulon response regulator PhoB